MSTRGRGRDRDTGRILAVVAFSLHDNVLFDCIESAFPHGRALILQLQTSWTNE